MTDFSVRIAHDDLELARVAAFFGAIEGPEDGVYFEGRGRHPRYRPEFSRYIELDGRIVCAAGLRYDRLLIDGAALDAGFVDNILTHPDYRGRGLFRALLNDSLQYLLDEGFPLSTLHGPVKLYAPFGYVPVRWHALALLPVAQAVSLPWQWRARPLVESDLPDVGALYAATYGQMAGSEERTPGVWRYLWSASWPGMAQSNIGVEDQAGRLAAYAVMERRAFMAPASVHVIEAAAADTEAALALLASLGRRGQEAESARENVYLPFPPEHVVARAALLAGGEARLVGPQAEGSRYGHEDQALVLDLAAALASLAPALARRLAASPYADWQGAIGVDTEDESANLEIDRGQVQVTPRGPFVGDALYLPSTLLAPLFLGTYGARDLTAWPGVRASESLTGLLAALFPPRLPFSENENWWA